MKYSIMYIRIEALHARLWCCLFGAASQPFEEAFVLRLDQTFCLRENQFMICPSHENGVVSMSGRWSEGLMDRRRI